MRTPFFAVFVLGVSACASNASQPQTNPGATPGTPKAPVSQRSPIGSGAVLIENARVYGHPGATSLLVVDGRIHKLGGTELDAQLAARRVDAKGGVLLPGFHDAHVHMMSGGLSLSRVDIEGAKTVDETLAQVKAWADANPQAPWVIGRGWSYDIVPKGTFPTAAMLDRVVSDRPCALNAYDGHTVWLNSKALAAAHIVKETLAPPGGTIVKDAGGVPTGALLEDAEVLLDEVIPPPTRAQKKAAFLAAAQHLVKLGVTAVDAIEAGPESMELLLELEQEGALPFFVQLYLPIDSDLDQLSALREKSTQRVRLAGVKGFVDGVIESKTAYMVQPYEGEAHARGKPILGPKELFGLVDAADARGFQVLLHAIGDGAVRLALDAFERTHRAHPYITRRHRVEHIEVLHKDDAARFSDTWSMASMQPYHATPGDGDPNAGAWSENVGKSRLPHTFPWRSLLDKRVGLAFGSDWPVFTASPLWGLAVATTRRSATGNPKEGWNRHQAITMDEAIAAYTTDRGEAAGPSLSVGRIAVGQRADLVLLSPDAKLEEPLSLFQAKVALTMVEGRVVH